MTVRQNIPCVLLAGGNSSRFGQPKGLVDLGDHCLIEHVINRLAPQTSIPLAINASLDSSYAQFSETVLADVTPNPIGPIGGLLTALEWASEHGYPEVVTTPIDTPFLPANFIAKLATGEPPAIASCNGRQHYVVGIWPTRVKSLLLDFIGSGQRAMKAWAHTCDARLCEFENNSEIDPFFNINTPDDLETAQRFLSSEA